MEIIYKNKRNIPFKMVAIGEVFCYDGALYMSIQESTSKSTGELYNAVNLADGESTYFYENEVVLLVKAQIIVS